MIRLSSIGQCSIDIGEMHITPTAETLFAAALYLALEDKHQVSRREMMEILWPRATERRAYHCLRQVVYKLNAQGAVLRSERTHILVSRRCIQTDCGAYLAAREGSELERLAENLNGTFLPGYAPAISAGFTEWLDRQRALMGSAFRRVLVGGITAKKARGEWRAAEAIALRCLEIDPLNEEATLAIAEAAAMQGSKVRAMTILDRYLHEIGPEAREIRLPATVLRRRIAEVYEGAVPAPPAPFVGREGEMATLMHALKLAADSQGAAFLVCGEPGIGKTRLVTEFMRNAGLQHMQLVRIGCQSHDERRPLSAFADLVPKLLELPGAIGSSPKSMRFLNRLTAHDPAQTTLSPDAREAEYLFGCIRRSILDLLDAIASEATLVIVVEDVHWLDHMSWELVEHIVQWMATRRILLVLTARPTDRPLGTMHADGGAIARISLPPLTDPLCRDLIGALLADVKRGDVDAFCDWCIASAGGNPYYIGELVAQSWHDGERYRAPASLASLITARLARLSGCAKRLLHACSVLGKLSTLDRLETVLQERRIALLEGLDELESFGMIELDGTHILPKHALLADAVLQGVAQASTALLHRHAALTLESEIAASPTTALLWECAEHWLAARERGRAITFLRQCARHAMEIGIPTEAIRLLEHATTLAEGTDQHLAVLDERVKALHVMGRWDALHALLIEKRGLADTLSPGRSVHDDDELLEADVYRRHLDPMARTIDALKECVRTPDANAQHRLRAALIGVTTAVDAVAFDDAHDLYSSVQSIHAPDRLASRTKQQLEMVYHCSFGTVELGAHAAHLLVASARDDGNAINLSHCLRQAAKAFAIAGLMDDAISSAREALAVAERLSLPNYAAAAAGHITEVYLQLDDIESAAAFNRVAIVWWENCTGRNGLVNIQEQAARIALHLGDWDKGRHYMDEAIVLKQPDNLASERATVALRMAWQLGATNQLPTPQQIDYMLCLHDQTKALIHHDYFAGVLGDALAACNMYQAAEELLTTYAFALRREKSPITATVRKYLKSNTQAPTSTSPAPLRHDLTDKQLSEASTSGPHSLRGSRERC